MTAPWIILRPRDEADALVAALRARGLEAHATPAIETHPLPIPPDVEHAIASAQAAGRLVLVLLTSARAAELVATTPLLCGQPLAALVPTTAEAARARGLTLDVTTAGGFLDLARESVAWLRARVRTGRALVVHPTSDAGLARADNAALEQTCAPVADLLRFPLYETRPDPGLAGALGALDLDAARYVVTSPTTVDALAGVPHPRAQAVLCRGASTVGAWRARFPAGPTPTLIPRDVSLEDAIARYPADP